MKRFSTILMLCFWFVHMTGQPHDLAYYVAQAKVRSPLLNQAKTDSKLTAIDLQQITNILSRPEVNFDLSILFAPIVSHDNDVYRFQWVTESANKYYGYDLASTDGGQYQGSVNLYQPLLNGKRKQVYTQKANLVQEQNQNTLILTAHEIEQLVNNQYIICLGAQKQSMTAKKLLTDLQAQLPVMKNLVNQAIYKQTDLMQLELEVDTYQTAYQVYLATYQSSLYDLLLICGLDDSIPDRLVDSSFFIHPKKATPSGFLKSYTLDSLTVEADQSIFEMKYKPEVHFFAQAGLNATYLPTLDRLGFSTGLTLSWNLFDGNQRHFQRNKSTINLEKIQFNKQYFINQNRQLKSKILRQIESLQTRLAMVEDQLTRYDELKTAYERELMFGEVSVMELKNLLKDRASKKQEAITISTEKQALINLYNYWNF